MPLRSCNTMSTDVDNGVEYFNTVVVQPHRSEELGEGGGATQRILPGVKAALEAFTSYASILFASSKQLLAEECVTDLRSEEVILFGRK